MSDSNESGVTYTPYAEDASPTAQSPEYVPESDLEAYPEEDDDEHPEEDPVDYPADGGDDGDDEEGSSKDDEDDDMDIEADEEEEHPAPADSVVVALPAVDHAPSAEETKPFETDESAATPPLHPTYRMTARISIPAPVPVPAWSESDAPSSGIPPPLPISAPTSSPPLQLPFASRREDRPEVTLPPRKRLDIALGPGYEVEESSSAAARPAGGLRADYGFVATMDREIKRDPERDVGYGITDSWNEIVETLQGAPVSTDTELGRYMREFETRVRRDTNEIYLRLDDEQSERQLLAGRLNMLFRDRCAHAYTRHLMETEARLSREAWVRSMDASDLARDEVMSLRTTVLGQTTEIRELHTAECRRQIVTSEMLRADHRIFAEIRGNCAVENQVKFATCTFYSVALTWWNTNVKTVGHDAAYGMPWKTLMKMMTDKYCPRNEIKKLEMEIWDLKVKGTDLTSYTQRFQELALLCGRMFPEESDKIERYIKGLLDMIHGSVVASKPKIMQEAVEIATELMDKKIRTFTERETTSKRKFKNTLRSTQNQQQQPNKRQNTGQVYTATSGEKKQYGGSKPLCAKCNYHHDSPCAPKCHKCNKFGHFTRDCAFGYSRDAFSVIFGLS
nr:hypothetical protein [Tanacetum cinerariifolium]